MNPTVELVLKHKKANMRKSDFLMLEALKSAPHLNDTVDKLEIYGDHRFRPLDSSHVDLFPILLRC